jgi:hypothetical protein
MRAPKSQLRLRNQSEGRHRGQAEYWKAPGSWAGLCAHADEPGELLFQCEDEVLRRRLGYWLIDFLANETALRYGNLLSSPEISTAATSRAVTTEIRKRRLSSGWPRLRVRINTDTGTRIH